MSALVLPRENGQLDKREVEEGVYLPLLLLLLAVDHMGVSALVPSREEDGQLDKRSRGGGLPSPPPSPPCSRLHGSVRTRPLERERRTVSWTREVEEGVYLPLLLLLAVDYMGVSSLVPSREEDGQLDKRSRGGGLPSPPPSPPCSRLHGSVHTCPFERGGRSAGQEKSRRGSTFPSSFSSLQ